MQQPTPRAWPWFAGMTLGDATARLHEPAIPCACAGPYPICACLQAAQHALMLERAAHIVAKLLTIAVTVRDGG